MKTLLSGKCKPAPQLKSNGTIQYLNAESSASDPLENHFDTYGTTCLERPGDTAAYWAPTLLVWDEVTQQELVVRPEKGRFYYTSEGLDGSLKSQIEPFPEDLKIVAGDHMATQSNPQSIDVFNWACQGTGDEVEKTEIPDLYSGSI